MIPFAVAAVALATPCHSHHGCLAAACVAGCPVTFFGPYLPATYSAGPNPAPDTLAGAPPHLSPAPVTFGYVVPLPKGEPLSAPTPLGFGPTGVPPRLGPGR